MTETRQLANFSGRGYKKGRPIPIQVAWLIASTLLISHWWCPNKARVQVLRIFGAKIGTGVIIRQNVRIHWPWKLTIGNNTWIGDGAWLLNLEPISIGQNVCISQEVLLCTGSHDRHSPTFEFDNAPITIQDGSWIAARATVLRGVTIGRRSTVGAMALVSSDVAEDTIVFAPRSQETTK